MIDRTTRADSRNSGAQGYITRDDDGCLFWHETKPSYCDDGTWDSDGAVRQILVDPLDWFEDILPGQFRTVTPDMDEPFLAADVIMPRLQLERAHLLAERDRLREINAELVEALDKALHALSALDVPTDAVSYVESVEGCARAAIKRARGE